ncbi:hypothetical protein B0T17DRAFT_497422 [Bombardia bombarda]|uniref:Uncharacterized protein n=1 Tax=Bombardia bombarda TaxID=252184 RepID=A0AA39WIJ3_9PEZI|nr:hypothetical protein B0T17DRAFT_497422 [Bombardia bombarda]
MPREVIGAHGGGGSVWSAASPTPQGISQLPMPQTMQNTELLRIYVKLISQFKASLDGNPDASNPYIKYYVPYSVQSPLLVHVAIYTGAGFLSQMGHIDTTVAMSHKGHAIALLNEHLQSNSSTSDEGIAGVVQLIVNEWYWGDPNDLRAHLRGLREMIRIRGGFRTLGLHGLLSKLAITSDVAIALSFEISPFLRGGKEFEFHENTQTAPLRLALNTPLVSSLASFASCDEALHIHSATASILDDMRFLIAAALALPKNASTKELQKVHSTSAWIYERISMLPRLAPATRRPSSVTSPIPSSTASLIIESSSRDTPEVGEEQREPRGSHKRPRRGKSQGSPPQQHRGLLTPTQALAENKDHRYGLEQSPPPPGEETPDFVYQAVLLGALMYSRAIMTRQPFSQVVGTDSFVQLWTTMWRVPLATWRSLLGVFNWLVLPLVPSGKSTHHDLYVRSMMNASLLQMSMDNWEIACGAMDAALRLQHWLGAEGHGSDSASSPSDSGAGNGRRESSSEGEGDVKES